MKTLIVVGIMLASGAAVAQPSRANAEALEKAAKDSRELAKLVACGKAYLDLYNAAPTAPDSDELLYNAAVCFEEGKSIGVAVTTHEQLRKAFPTSKLGPRATARLSQLYVRSGNLPKAAAMLEEYATKYAGEKDAAAAMSDAARLRGALGDDAKRIQDTQFYIRTFGVKQPGQAAEAMFSLIPVYERRGRDEAIKHVREYIASYGSKGGADRLVRAYAKLGELLWQQACPITPTDGLCMKVTRDRVLPLLRMFKPQGKPTHCGPTAPVARTITLRDAKKQKEAIAALQAADKELKKLQPPEPATRAAHALALIYLADARLEAYLAVKFPTNLDFSPTKQQVREASLKRFNDYIGSKVKLGQDARQQYEAVLALKEPTGMIAAASRVGAVLQALATELATAEIPKDVRADPYAADKIAALCDRMEEVAEPMFKQAIEAYDLCIDKASSMGITGEWAKLCTRERAQLAPTTFALTTELVPAAPFALPIQTEGPVRATAHAPAPFADALKLYEASDPLEQLPRALCDGLAAKFDAVAKQSTLADAHYMVGLVFGRCDKLVEAKAAYERALQVQPAHAAAMSNLGELAWRAGNVAAAVKQWNAALAIEPKLFAAHLDVAAVASREPTRSKQADQDIRMHVDTATAVSDSNEPYVLLAILALEAPDAAKRLSLTRYYAGLAGQGTSSLAGSLVLAALYQRDEHPAALGVLERAVADHPRSDAANLALGLHDVKLRRWDAARSVLDAVKTKSYELAIARGIVARGMNKVSDAEARYSEAIALDAARPEAHYNLGVLWKDHVAARSVDPAAAKVAFRKAAESFRRVGTPEAKLYAGDCDKAIAVLSP